MLFGRWGRAKRRRLDKAAAVASDGGEDSISALPDDALHHILSFLPSDEAVKTCVLARRWRHLWRSTRSLRVTPRPRRRGFWYRPWTPSKLTSFVNHFLLLRGAAVPVDECDILCGELDGDSEEHFSHAYHRKLDDELNWAACLWIRHAVANSQARLLRVCFQTKPRLCLDYARFESQLLTRVEAWSSQLPSFMEV
jgi:hypothetical protein